MLQRSPRRARSSMGFRVPERVCSCRKLAESMDHRRWGKNAIPQVPPRIGRLLQPFWVSFICHPADRSALSLRAKSWRRACSPLSRCEMLYRETHIAEGSVADMWQIRSPPDYNEIISANSEGSSALTIFAASLSTAQPRWALPPLQQPVPCPGPSHSL